MVSIDGRRCTSYRSTYFDTADLASARAHVQQADAAGYRVLDAVARVRPCLLKLSKTVADALGTRCRSRRPACCTRRCKYRWMQSEIDYSRVYMAGHTPSDVTGGALLGDMIGAYFAVTRAH